MWISGTIGSWWTGGTEIKLQLIASLSKREQKIPYLPKYLTLNVRSFRFIN